MALYFAWNSILLLAQVWAGLFSGSVSVLAVAAYTFSCLLSVLIARFATSAAARPADDSHRFGHGKIESLWSAGEAFGMLIAVVLVVYVGIQRLYGFGPVLIVRPEVAMGLLVVSAAGNYFVSSRAPGLWAKGQPPSKRKLYRQPVWDAAVPFGAAVGLLIVSLTGLVFPDFVFAAGISGIVVYLAWNAGYRSFKGLVDTRLPKHELRFVTDSIREHLGEAAGYRELRTRRSGTERFIEMALVFPRAVTLSQAHDVCDRLESDIRDKVPNSYVIIHCEPCDGGSADSCGDSCPAVRNCHSIPRR